MKKQTLTATIALLILCICFIFFLQNKRNGETVVSIKDTETSYAFNASFHSGLMPKVTRYMDSCAGVLRKDQVNFRIKTNAGELAITADKQLNSPITMGRIRKMCQGISDIIIQH